MSSRAPLVKAALFAACQSLYAAPVQVSYGHPGTDVEADVVSVAGVRSAQDVATMTTSRTREETLTLDVIFSSYVGGGPESQQTATERAYALLALLENYLQTTDYTLGGTCRLARMIDHTLAEPDDPDVLAAGRVAEITAQIQASVRI